MTYRILAFSGGGMRGLFQAKVLEELQKGIGEFWKKYDLIAGTSTGAIVALGLGLGKSPQDIGNLFINDGPTIFSKQKSKITRGPLYNNSALLNAFQNVFATSNLNSCQPNVAILSTYLHDFSVRVFSPLTAHSDGLLPVVDVAMASSAAPAFFPAVKVEDDAYVDGGMWGNNPSLAAITLANQNKGIPFSNMKVLHIGNGEQSVGCTIGTHNKKVPALMLLYLINGMFAAQSSTVLEATERIVGAANVHNINVPLNPFIELNDHRSAIKRLPGLAATAAAQHLAAVTAF